MSDAHKLDASARTSRNNRIKTSVFVRETIGVKSGSPKMSKANFWGILVFQHAYTFVVSAAFVFGG
ncbi:MAG: hypothetical protein J6Q89_04490, partial [Clostridia bacterium]|nr:hypothetical protein [Clostridia bacterium]